MLQTLMLTGLLTAWTAWTAFCLSILRTLLVRTDREQNRRARTVHAPCTHRARTVHADQMQSRRKACKSNVTENPYFPVQIAGWRSRAYPIEMRYNRWLIGS